MLTKSPVSHTTLTRAPFCSLSDWLTQTPLPAGPEAAAAPDISVMSIPNALLLVPAAQEEAKPSPAIHSDAMKRLRRTCCRPISK